MHNINILEHVMLAQCGEEISDPKGKRYLVKAHVPFFSSTAAPCTLLLLLLNFQSPVSIIIITMSCPCNYPTLVCIPFLRQVGVPTAPDRPIMSPRLYLTTPAIAVSPRSFFFFPLKIPL